MSLKFNWGTGIVIGFVAFICFILYFVLQLYIDPSMTYDLSTPDYYKEELAYQLKIERIERANQLVDKVQFIQTSKELQIVFPKSMNYKKITGKLLFYRPSDKSLDLHIAINLATHEIVIPKNILKPGSWELTINWEYDTVTYTNIYKFNL